MAGRHTEHASGQLPGAQHTLAEQEQSHKGRRMFAFVAARSKQEAKEPPRPVLPHLPSLQTILSLSLPRSHLLYFLINGGQALPNLPMLPSFPSRLFVGITTSLRFLIFALTAPLEGEVCTLGSGSSRWIPRLLGFRPGRYRSGRCWKLQNDADYNGDRCTPRNGWRAVAAVRSPRGVKVRMAQWLGWGVKVRMGQGVGWGGSWCPRGKFS